MPNDNEYTPTTGAIQDAYCHVQQEVLGEHGDSAHERFHAEFARWLDAHDAEVRAEANPAVTEDEGGDVFLNRYSIHHASFGGIGGDAIRLDITREAWKEMGEPRSLKVSWAALTGGETA